MALVDALRSGVAAIRSTLRTGGLLVTVQREPYEGTGLSGRDKWGARQTVPDVLFEDVDARVVTFQGTDTVVRATLTIFDPALIVSAKDRWVLPDGREMSAKIVRPNVVPADGGRITTEVLLG